MELLNAVEALVKNPLLDVSLLDNTSLSKNLVDSYKNSETHKIRELVAEKQEFSDMSHVFPMTK